MTVKAQQKAGVVTVNGVAYDLAELEAFRAAKQQEAAREALGILEFVTSAPDAQGVRRISVAVGSMAEPRVGENGRGSFFNESGHFGHGTKVYTLEVKAYEFISKDRAGNPRPYEYPKQVEKDKLNGNWLGEF